MTWAARTNDKCNTETMMAYHTLNRRYDSQRLVWTHPVQAEKLMARVIAAEKHNRPEAV